MKEDASKFARPAGWSDYQSAWLDGVQDDQEAKEEVEDHGELADQLNQRKGDHSVMPDDDDDAMMDVDDEEDNIDLEQRRKLHKEHDEFPDEVQVDEDAKAGARFARYRSLKSFRKSYWDPKENLPVSYSTL
jgi:hypothetical protein